MIDDSVCSSNTFSSIRRLLTLAPFCRVHRFLVSGDCPLGFFLMAVEPVLAPDAVEGPAESLQVFLAKPVAVAGGGGGVVGGAVAFDGEDHLARAGGVLGGVVDPVARAAILGIERDPGGVSRASTSRSKGLRSGLSLAALPRSVPPDSA